MAVCSKCGAAVGGDVWQLRGWGWGRLFGGCMTLILEAVCGSLPIAKDAVF